LFDYCVLFCFFQLFLCFLFFFALFGGLFFFFFFSREKQMSFFFFHFALGQNDNANANLHLALLCPKSCNSGEQHTSLLHHLSHGQLNFA